MPIRLLRYSARLFRRLLTTRNNLTQEIIMSLNSVLSATGIAAVLYSAYRLAPFMNVYLRPSSLEKYLTNGAYPVVTGDTDRTGQATALELAGRGFNNVCHDRHE